MNTDYRISVSLPNHHKTAKLIRRIGKDGMWSLICLWAYTAQNRPDGTLTDLDADDIAIAAKWDGDPDKFISTLVEVGFLDQTDDGLIVHDWTKHNGYASSANIRSEAARAAAQKRWDARLNGRDGMQNACGRIADASKGQCEAHAGALLMHQKGNAPYPNPNPNPYPEPNPNQKEEKVNASSPSGDDARARKPAKNNTAMTDEQFIDSLANNPAYAGIDVRREFGKMMAWLALPKNKAKKATKARFLNWLNRCDPGMNAADPNDNWDHINGGHLRVCE